MVKRLWESEGSFDLAAIERHLHQLALAKRGPAAIAQAVAAFRSFGAWLADHGWIDRNPTLGLRGPRRYRRQAQHLSQAEVKRLLHYGPAGPRTSSDPAEARDRAILACVYYAGLRPGEVGALRFPEDVEVIEVPRGNRTDRLMALVVRRAKWSTEDRSVYLEGDASRVLEAYLAVRNALVGGKTVPWLFPSFRGSRLVGGISRWGVSDIVARRCREHHIEPRGRTLSPRILRHSIATHLVASGVHLREVQEHLRHRSPSSTQVYAHAATGANRALLIERHHPLRGRARRPEVAAASLEVLRQLHAGISSPLSQAE